MLWEIKNTFNFLIIKYTDQMKSTKYDKIIIIIKQL
jgi:hypothetical protein